MSEVASTTWRMLAQRTGGRELPRGLDAAWDAAAGLAQKLLPRTARFLRQADVVLGYEEYFATMTAAKLRAAGEEFRDLFRLGRNTSEDLLRAFAMIREVAARQIGLKAYRVQVAGALALHAGCIVEKATGEGKTLAATMPATVAGWPGMIISAPAAQRKTFAPWRSSGWGKFGDSRSWAFGTPAEDESRRLSQLAVIPRPSDHGPGYDGDGKIGTEAIFARMAFGPRKTVGAKDSLRPYFS